MGVFFDEDAVNHQPCFAWRVTLKPKHNAISALKQIYSGVRRRVRRSGPEPQMREPEDRQAMVDAILREIRAEQAAKQSEPST